MYTQLHIYTYVGISNSICMYTVIHIHVHIYTYTHIYIYIYLYIDIYIYHLVSLNELFRGVFPRSMSLSFSCLSLVPTLGRVPTEHLSGVLLGVLLLSFSCPHSQLWASYER